MQELGSEPWVRLHFVLGKAQVLRHEVVRERRPVSRPGPAGQARLWIFEIVQGLMMGRQLEVGVAQGLRLSWGPKVAFASGQVWGQPAGFGLGLRELSGLGSDLGFERSALEEAL